MSLFDDIQKATFSTTTELYGDVAVWIKENETITDKVLFKNPNDPIQIGSEDKYEYRPYNYSFEYYEGQFQGLKELVESGNTQTITVKGFELNIRRVIGKFDGKTFTAFGELKQ